MKQFLSILFVGILATVANAQDYPTGEDDPNFQREGYKLVVVGDLAERVALFRQWAVDEVNEELAAKIITKQKNRSIVDIWGGWAVTAELDVPYWGIPGFWYYMKGIRMWWWSPLEVGPDTPIGS